MPDTSVPQSQTATLSNPTPHQFQTSGGVDQTLNITNQSVQEVASVMIQCSSWENPPSMPITIDPFKNYFTMTKFGGAPMVITNVTNPNNPATVQVTLNTAHQG
ncbi:MAG: hypothetical protein QNJ16_00840 [Rhodobacter sp.]|nr:hypothetical protein [Rhodobacter sp.]